MPSFGNNTGVSGENDWLAVRSAAAGLLGDAGALSEGLAESVVAAGGVAPLSALATGGGESEAAVALEALARLSRHADSTAAAVAAGGGVVAAIAKVCTIVSVASIWLGFVPFGYF